MLICIIFIQVWRKIEAEIDGKEYKNTDDYGDHYFCKCLCLQVKLYNSITIFIYAF